MADKKDTAPMIPEQPAKKKKLSRRASHRVQAIAVIAIALILVVLVNVIAGLLVDRNPYLKADFTPNSAFDLNDDTVEIMSHLNKDVQLHMVKDEKTFTDAGTYFVQAKNLLDKMEAKSNGKFTCEFSDIAETPNFTKKYDRINWKDTDIVGVIECGDRYTALTLDDCFTVDEEKDSDYYAYFGTHLWTGTTIEQAVAKGTLFVTSDESVVVDILTGEGESGYDDVKKLLTDNAYEVNEVSLLTGDLDSNATFALIFAPQADISENAAEKLRKWLENGGNYGRNLIYVPNANPYITEWHTPNLDAVLKDWGMELYNGFVFETDDNYRWDQCSTSKYSFLVDYCDKYTENLKNPNLDVAAYYAMGINITDPNTAHALLQTSDKAGVWPADAGADFNMLDNIKGEPIPIAAEGTRSGDDASSNVIVFSSSMMFSSELMNYPSFNNKAFFMNVMNTIADKDDNTIVIEGRTLQTPTLGKPSVSTQNVIYAIFAFIIPGLILVAGIVLWIRRRNR